MQDRKKCKNGGHRPSHDECLSQRGTKSTRSRILVKVSGTQPPSDEMIGAETVLTLRARGRRQGILILNGIAAGQR
jgi:hypothetical protein